MHSEPIAIRVNQLSKMYQLRHLESYHTLTDTIANTVKRPIRKVFGSRSTSKNSPGAPEQVTCEEFWALKDVSFDVRQGEVVGIIGRNGAGKSTLLKILSRITTPTEGIVEIHGRVGSLLEVGTGFHPELTGRENIFLSGSILGMKKTDIEQKFEDIVKFAEIELFLDTPVKRYSSGMYIRLAFAVAAHLDTEVLIVDEVLAVGDFAFQKKCLGKMQDVARHGRTVLFVSHNMQAIRHLCSRAILFEKGNIVDDGSPGDIIARYLNATTCVTTDSDLIMEYLSQLPEDPVFKFRNIELLQNNLQIGQTVSNGDALEIIVSYEVKERTTGLRVFFDLSDSEETLLFRSFNDELGEGIPVVEPGKYTSTAIIPADLLSPINYELKIFATISGVRNFEPKRGIIIPLSVVRTGRANKAYLHEEIRGKLAPIIPWINQKNQEG